MSIKKRYYILIAVVLIASAVGIYLYTQQSENQPEDTSPPPHVVELPGGTWVIDNELVLLFGWNSSESLQDVESLVIEFGGEITRSIPEIMKVP